MASTETEKSDYGIRTQLAVPYDEAVEKTTAALKAEGFGVLTEIDVKKTLKVKLDKDFRKYIILGACNPPLAHRALSAELELGLFLPCNVIVYESDGGSVVSAMDPMVMVQMIANPALEAVAKEARGALERALARLSKDAAPA